MNAAPNKLELPIFLPVEERFEMARVAVAEKYAEDNDSQERADLQDRQDILRQRPLPDAQTVESRQDQHHRDGKQRAHFGGDRYQRHGNEKMTSCDPRTGKKNDMKPFKMTERKAMAPEKVTRNEDQPERNPISLP